MNIFLIMAAVYVGVLVWIRPAPSNLNVPLPSYRENMNSIGLTLLLGVMLMVIHLLITSFTFTGSPSQNLYVLLALNNVSIAPGLWPMQTMTHSFIHANFMHLFANVSTLALLSVYERRAGHARYTKVMFAGILAAIPSILFYDEPLAVCGISGGLFGLAAAYFTDHEDMSSKEWVIAIAGFAIFAWMFTFFNDLKSEQTSATLSQDDFATDHIGHILGAIGAIIYCRLAPLKEKLSKKDEPRATT